MAKQTTAFVVALGLALAAPGCALTEGPSPSIIVNNRFLAVQSSPPEVVDPAQGANITATALIASPTGTIWNAPLLWDFCLVSKPLSENNAVAAGCESDDPMNEQPFISATTTGPAMPGTLPSPGCTLFGPNPPSSKPGDPPLRAQDPDVTGGYYQPVRVKYIAGASSGADLEAYGAVRMQCGVANAPSALSLEYNLTYRRNRNPAIAGVWGGVNAGALQPLVPETIVVPDGGVMVPMGGVMPVPDGALVSVPRGAAVTLRGEATADSQENFLVYDSLANALVTQPEALGISWFATGGSFSVESTPVGVQAGPGGDGGAGMPACPAPDGGPGDFAWPDDAGPAPSTGALGCGDTLWTAPAAAGTHFLWAVLRDSRGGVDFRSFVVQVE